MFAPPAISTLRAMLCCAIVLLSLPVGIQAGSEEIGADSVEIIMSAAERKMYESQDTESRRQAFLEAFWQAHDPTPGTEKNEFKDEFLRRRSIAVTRYAEGNTDGLHTYRGRIFLRLGEPVQVVQYTNPAFVSELEVWLYPPDRSHGIRYNFYILFFQPPGSDYMRPFRPGKDEPSDLIAPALDPGSEIEALKALMRLDVLIGQLTISLFPSQHRPLMINNTVDLRRALNRRSNRASSLLKALEGGPLPDDYEKVAAINRLMKGSSSGYRMKISDSPLDIPYQLHILRDEAGDPRLYLSIGIPADYLGLYEGYGRCYAQLQCSLQVISDGNSVRSMEEKITASLDLWNVHNGSSGQVAYYTTLDLDPGQYRVQVELIDLIGGSRFAFEEQVDVPRALQPRLTFYGPILIEKVEEARAEGNRLSYTFYDKALQPAVYPALRKGSDATFYYQLFFPRRDRTHSVTVRYSVRRGDRTIWEQREVLDASQLRPGSFFSRTIQVPTGRYPTGAYIFEITAQALSPPEARASIPFAIHRQLIRDGENNIARAER